MNRKYVIITSSEYDKLKKEHTDPEVKVSWEVLAGGYTRFSGNIDFTASLYRQIKNVVSLACEEYAKHKDILVRQQYSKAVCKFSNLSLWQRIFFKPEYLQEW